MFLVGNWRYGGVVRVIKYLVVNAVFILVFLVGLKMFLAPVFSNYYARFFTTLLGYLGLGASMTSFIPLVLIKWNILEFVDEKH